MKVRILNVVPRVDLRASGRFATYLTYNDSSITYNEASVQYNGEQVTTTVGGGDPMGLMLLFTYPATITTVVAEQSFGSGPHVFINALTPRTRINK